jgi:hypothetical protein
MNGKIWEALAKFEAPEINLDAENNFFKSKYATLGNIIKKIREPLKEAGLWFTQWVEAEHVVTRIYCISDESFIESRTNLNVGNDAQGKGKEITYYKRYHLAAMLGLVAEDDNDAQAPDAKPKMNAKILEKALARIADGEENILDNVLSSMQVTAEDVRALVGAENGRA